MLSSQRSQVACSCPHAHCQSLCGGPASDFTARKLRCGGLPCGVHLCRHLLLLCRLSACQACCRRRRSCWRAMQGSRRHHGCPMLSLRWTRPACAWPPSTAASTSTSVLCGSLRWSSLICTASCRAATHRLLYPIVLDAQGCARPHMARVHPIVQCVFLEWPEESCTWLCHGYASCAGVEGDVSELICLV